MRVYISGGITGVEGYKENFAKAEKQLKEDGHEVINPTAFDDILPRLTYEQYMKLDLCLLDMCDAIYLQLTSISQRNSQKKLCTIQSKKKLFRNILKKKNMFLMEFIERKYLEACKKYIVLDVVAKNAVIIKNKRRFLEKQRLHTLQT